MGRPRGPIRARTPEARALAVFLRERVEESQLTLAEIADRTPYSKSRVGELLSGDPVPDARFVVAVVKVTVPEPQRQAVQLDMARRLLEAAENPKEQRAHQNGDHDQDLAGELARAREQRMETLEELARVLERQSKLQETEKHSTHLVVVLLTMINTLQSRVQSLSAERDRLLGRAGGQRLLQETQQRLARALDQERRAKEELDRAQDKQRKAEHLAARVQLRVDELTDELDRLRAGEPDPGPSEATDGSPHTGLGDSTIPADPVADDIEQALARAVSVNDKDEETLHSITVEMQNTGQNQDSPDSPVGAASHPTVVPDNPDNPPTSAATTSGPSDPPQRGATTGAVEPVIGVWTSGSLPDPDAFSTRHHLGADLEKAKEWTGAALVFSELAADRARELGPDHPDTLYSRYRHAYNVGESGDRMEAAQLFAELAADRERVLGPDHPETFRSRHLHAYNLEKAEAWAAAAQAFDRLATDQARVLGHDHHDTFNSRRQRAYNVGLTVGKAGAAQMYAQLADDYARVLGPDHPTTLEMRANSLQHLAEAGRRLEVAKPISELVADRTRVLGADHPQTLATRAARAYNLGELGNRVEAAQLFAELAADYARILGPDHPDTLWMRYHHAFNVAELGQWSEAARLFGALTKARERVLGPQHEETLRTRYHYASSTGKAGRRFVSAMLFAELFLLAGAKDDFFK